MRIDSMHPVVTCYGLRHLVAGRSRALPPTGWTDPATSTVRAKLVITRYGYHVRTIDLGSRATGKRLVTAVRCGLPAGTWNWRIVVHDAAGARGAGHPRTLEVYPRWSEAPSRNATTGGAWSPRPSSRRRRQDPVGSASWSTERGTPRLRRPPRGTGVESNRSKECSAPPSSTNTAGPAEAVASRRAKSRAVSTGISESLSPCTTRNGGACGPIRSNGELGPPGLRTGP